MYACSCVRTYTHLHVHTRTHTYSPNTHAYRCHTINTCMHTCIYLYHVAHSHARERLLMPILAHTCLLIHTQTHTHTHTHTHTRTHIHTSAFTYAHTSTRIHTSTHTHAHTHALTHAHTHAHKHYFDKLAISALNNSGNHTQLNCHSSLPL